MSKRRKPAGPTAPTNRGAASPKTRGQRQAPAHAIEAPRWWQSHWSIAAALTLLVAVVFAPLRHADFISLDDHLMVSENPHITTGFTAANALWAFGVRYNFWMPAVWMSYLADVSLHGVNAGWMHVTNVLLHLASTLALYGALVQMTGARGKSAFVAALFAVHPLHVESVAWITERKDALSTPFWWLSTWAYIAWVQRQRWTLYAASLLCLAIGMTAKPMLVTLPFTLLLLDVWPLGRWSLDAPAVSAWRLIKEKWMFFTVAAVSAVFALIAQGTAVATTKSAPMFLRVENAFVSYMFYLVKTFWPTGLIAFYPYDPWMSMSLVGACVLAFVALTTVAIVSIRRRPYLTVGWLWYVGTLLPVIGLIKVGNHARADRYTYVPLVGIFLAVTWGVTELAARWRNRRVILSASAVAAVLALAAAAGIQTSYWHDSVTLWTHALDVNPDNYLAHDHLGTILFAEGRQDEAVQHLTRAVDLNPPFSESHFNLGVALMNLGQFDRAAAEYREALRIQPDYAMAHANLGLLLAVGGKTEDAIREYTTALALDPDLTDVHISLGAAYQDQHKLDLAVQEYEQALRIDPRIALAHFRLGLARADEGRTGDAISEYSTAVELKPDFIEARFALGTLLARTGHVPDAVQQFREVLRLNPQHEGARQALQALVKQPPDA